MEMRIGHTDIKPIIFGVFTILFFNILSVFPLLLSPSFMLVPSLVFLAPLPPVSIFLGIVVTVILAQKKRKKQVICMILVLQSLLILLNLVHFDAPRPLLTNHYQSATGGIYMLLTLVTNTPVYILFGVFTAWAYEKLFGDYLNKPHSNKKDSANHQ